MGKVDNSMVGDRFTIILAWIFLYEEEMYILKCCKGNEMKKRSYIQLKFSQLESPLLEDSFKCSNNL